MFLEVNSISMPIERDDLFVMNVVGEILEKLVKQVSQYKLSEFILWMAELDQRVLLHSAQDITYCKHASQIKVPSGPGIDGAAIDLVSQLGHL